MLIDYSATKTFTETVQIDDPGRCAIHGAGTFRDGKITFDGDYYMVVSTLLGQTTFIKWGPLVPDINKLPNTFKLEVKTSPYKEATIEKELKNFINDGFKNIQMAEELDIEDALLLLPQMSNYLSTLS